MERQDIDALLISALYGELTPADEARLQTHLESHPADKTALADLTLARNAVRESRFLTVQLEPPQAVSALLLQEASRRAKPVAQPQEKSEGWFQRFVRSFAAHPAMAAAAMLVLVVGVAGTMYVRNGAQNADRSTETFGASERAMSPSLAPGVAKPEDSAVALQRNAGSAFQAQLAEPGATTPTDEGAHKGDLQQQNANGEKAEAKPQVEGKKTEAPRAEPSDKKAANRTYLQTETKPTPKPMDLDERSKISKGNAKDGLVAGEDDAFRVNRKPGGGAPTGNVRTPPPAVVVTPRNDPAPTAPQQAPQAPKTVGRGSANTDTALRDGKLEKEKTDEETTWARQQHAKVATAVKANNCKEATQLAIALFNRAPAYYNASVENDRELKQCMAYITAERDREVERTQRARALKQRNADEAKRPAPAKPTQSNDSLNHK